MLIYFLGIFVALATMYYFNRHKNSELHTPLFPALGIALLSWFVPVIFLSMLLAYKLKNSKFQLWFENKH